LTAKWSSILRTALTKSGLFIRKREKSASIFPTAAVEPRATSWDPMSSPDGAPRSLRYSKT